MNKALRNICCVVAIPLLSACAALQIDVDVYKGPLSEEEDVQIEQLISLAMTSQRLLDDLQRQLMKDILVSPLDRKPDDLSSDSETVILSFGPSKADFSCQKNTPSCNNYIERGHGKPGYPTFKLIRKKYNNQDVSYGKIDTYFCKTLRDQNWVLRSGVKKQASLVARLSMSCNLEDLLALFDDDKTSLLLREFLKTSTENFKKVVSLKQLTSLQSNQQSENVLDNRTNEVSTNVNQRYREFIDVAIVDILSFMSEYQRGQKGQSPGYLHLELQRDLATILSTLINPNELIEAEKLLNEPVIFQQNKNMTTQTIKEKAYEVKNQLTNNPDSITALLRLREELKYQCDNNIVANERLCSTGFARGVSLTNSEALNPQELIDKYEYINDSISSSQSLNAARYPLGIKNLAYKAKYENELGKDSVGETKKNNRKLLFSMLLNYAGKLVVLADKQVLLDGELKGKQEASSQYVQVLQSLGSAIIVQINDIKARERHTKKDEEMRALDEQLADHHFVGSTENYKSKILAKLTGQKNETQEQINKLTNAQKKLAIWRTSHSRTSDLKNEVENLENWLLSLNNYISVTKNKELQESQKNIDLTNYLTKLDTQVTLKAKEEYCLLAGKPCAALSDVQIISKSSLNKVHQLRTSENLQAVLFKNNPQSLLAHSTYFSAQLEKKRSNVQTELTSKEAAFDASKKNSDKALAELTKLIDEKAKNCISTSECDAISANLITQNAKLTLLTTAIQTVKDYSADIKDGVSFEQWADKLVSDDSSVNRLITQAKSGIEQFYLPNGFSCKDSEKCTPDHIMRGVVRHIENLQIALQLKGASSKELQNVQTALRNAYDLTTRRQYLIPTSAYLRSSYPSSAMQQNNSASDWQNMLQQSALQSLPIIGNNFANESHVHQQVDKQYWQNINTVRVTGGGKTNYVVVKDDIGNWYVKGYSSDPEQIYKTIANSAITNTASTTGYFLNSGNGAVELKSSGNVLDAMYGRFYEKYANSTNAQFSTLNKWLDDKSWESYLSKTCVPMTDKQPPASAESIEKIIGKDNLSTYVSKFEAHKKAFGEIKDDDKDAAVIARAKSINSMLKSTANFANYLIAQSLEKCTQSQVEGAPPTIIGDDLYDQFVATEASKRQKALETFKQNILFIREGLPENELVSTIGD